MTTSNTSINTVATAVTTEMSALEQAFATTQITADEKVEEVGGVNIEKAGAQALSSEFDTALTGLALMDMYYDNCIAHLPKAGALTKDGKKMKRHWAKQRENMNRFKAAVTKASVLAIRTGSLTHIQKDIEELISQNVLGNECFDLINDFGLQALTFGWPTLNEKMREKNARDRGLRSAQDRAWYPNYAILIPSEKGYSISTKKGDYVISNLEALRLYNSLKHRQDAPYSWNAVMDTKSMDYDGKTGVVEDYAFTTITGEHIVLDGKKRISCEFDMVRVLTYPILAAQNPSEYGFYSEVTKKLFGTDMYLSQDFGEYSWYIACLNYLTVRVNGNRIWKSQGEQLEMVKSGQGLCKQYGFTSLEHFFNKEIAIPQILRVIKERASEKAAARVEIAKLPARTPVVVATTPAPEKKAEPAATMSEQDAIKAFLDRKQQLSPEAGKPAAETAAKPAKTAFSAANEAAAAATSGATGAPDLDLEDLDAK